MKLTDSVINQIGSKEAKAVRTKLALALNFTERWILKCIQENKENGPLTTVKAVQILKKETSLSQSEILAEGQHEPKAA